MRRTNNKNSTAIKTSGTMMRISRSASPVPSTQRRGGMLFRDNSQYQLPRVKYPEAKKGIMKVASLEDSLRSCLLAQERQLMAQQQQQQQQQQAQRRVSLTLESLLLHNYTATSSSSSNPKVINNDAALSLSYGTGLDLMQCHQPASSSSVTKALPEQYSSSGTTTRTVPCDDLSGPMSLDDDQDVAQKQSVRFATVGMREYPVAPDDHPGVTGKGAAIALRGWQFKALPSTQLEDYEATRPPRRAMNDLKMNVMERRQRLLEHGASQQELADFGKRVAKAKLKRAETVQALKIYGNQHDQKEERRENLGRFLQRAFRLRKTDSKAEAALWDQAQQQKRQQPQQAMAAASS